MTIRQRIENTKERIEKAALRSGRNPEEICLMGVSKFINAEIIEEAVKAGLLLFGESRVQEAVKKFPALKEKHPKIKLHMIGPLQRNKVKYIPGLFNTVESVDRDELIAALGKAADKTTSPLGEPLAVLLEMHTGEESKTGYPGYDALAQAVEQVLSFSCLHLAGLMTIAPFTKEEQPIRASFKSLYTAREKLKKEFPQADFSCLSMGMSNDFETAIEEGSTLVRVGTAIFGEQTP